MHSKQFLLEEDFSSYHSARIAITAPAVGSTASSFNVTLVPAVPGFDASASMSSSSPFHPNQSNTSLSHPSLLGPHPSPPLPSATPPAALPSGLAANELSAARVKRKRRPRPTAAPTEGASAANEEEDDDDDDDDDDDGFDAAIHEALVEADRKGDCLVNRPADDAAEKFTRSASSAPLTCAVCGDRALGFAN